MQHEIFHDSSTGPLERIAEVIRDSMPRESDGGDVSAAVPRIILIDGPAGCGKTHILREAVEIIEKEMDTTQLLHQVKSLDIFRGCFPWTNDVRIEHKEAEKKVYLLENIDWVLDAESDARIAQSNTSNKTSIRQDGNSAPRPILGDAEIDSEMYVLFKLVSALSSFAYHSGCLVLTTRNITSIHPWIRSKIHRAISIPALEGGGIDNTLIQLLLENISPHRVHHTRNFREKVTSLATFIEKSTPNFTGWASFGLVKRLACLALDLLDCQGTYGDSHERHAVIMQKLKETKCSSELGPNAGEASQFPNVTWDDIVGHSKSKKVLRQLVESVLRTGHFSPLAKQQATPADTNEHILFYGLPGTGKTMLAKATASAFGASFLELRLSDIVCAPVGGPEARLSTLFRAARECSPTIIFIDEIECFLSTHIESENSTIQALTELYFLEIDQINFRQEPIYVISATNAPHRIDQRLLRKGRIGRAIHVLPPVRDEIMMYCAQKSFYGISQDRIVEVIDCISEHFLNSSDLFADMPFLGGFTGYTLADIDSLLSTIRSIDTHGDFIQNLSDVENEQERLDTPYRDMHKAKQKVTRREIIQRAMETAPPSFTAVSLSVLVRWQEKRIPTD